MLMYITEYTLHRLGNLICQYQEQSLFFLFLSLFSGKVLPSLLESASVKLKRAIATGPKRPACSGQTTPEVETTELKYLYLAKMLNKVMQGVI